MTAMVVSDTCRAIRDLMRSGEITRQQGRTLIGQAKHGDAAGALKGLARLVSSMQYNSRRGIGHVLVKGGKAYAKAD